MPFMDQFPSRPVTTFLFLEPAECPCMRFAVVSIQDLAHSVHHSFALQIAVASGAVVIATSSSDEKLKTAAKLGAQHTINYTKTPDWDQEILKIVCSRDVVTRYQFTHKCS